MYTETDSANELNSTINIVCSFVGNAFSSIIEFNK